MSLLFKKLKNNQLYFLKFISFGVVSITGLFRTVVLDFEELGVWREVASLFAFLPLVFLLGVPNFLTLKVGERFSFILTTIIVKYISVICFFLLFFYFLIPFELFLYFFIVFMVFELLVSSRCIKISRINVLLFSQTVISLFELFFLGLYYLNVLNFNFDKTSIFIWMAFRSVFISFIIMKKVGGNLFCLDFNKFYFSLKELKFFLRVVPLSLSNNYFPMLAGSFLMNFDGLVLSKFMTSANLGFLSILIFFRSVLFLPLTLCGQKLSPIFRINNSSTYSVFRRESRKSSIFCAALVVPSCLVFACLHYINGTVNNGFFLFYFLIFYSILANYIGPVQTYLQAIGHGREAFFIDFFIIFFLFSIILYKDISSLLFLTFSYFLSHLLSYFLKYIYLFKKVKF